MTRLQTLLAPAIALGMSLSACAGSAYVVTDPPPPPRNEVVTFHPGHLWVDGHWVRSGSRWTWSEGYYVREHRNSRYVAGRWERRGDGGYVWIDGGFRARAKVVSR